MTSYPYGIRRGRVYCQYVRRDQHGPAKVAADGASRRAQNDRAVVAVAGCYPQTAQDEVKAIDGVDLILGTQDRHKIVSLVEEAVARKRGGEAVRLDDEVRPWDDGVLFEEMAGGNEEDKTRAYLKIEEGCNQYCSYCIIPYARGPVRSRSLESIRAEVEKLVAAGYREVVLIGIHLGCYGQDRKDGATLYDAVRAALSVPALQRLRLGSSSRWKWNRVS